MRRHALRARLVIVTTCVHSGAFPTGHCTRQASQHECEGGCNDDMASTVKVRELVDGLGAAGEDGDGGTGFVR